MSPSHSAWTSFWPGCGPPSGERPPVPRTPWWKPRRFTIDLSAKRVTRDGSDVHLTPKEWDIVEVLVRNPGTLVSHQQLLHEVWGPQYDTETEYLRVFMARVRRKLETDPSRPQHFVPNRAWATASPPDYTRHLVRCFVPCLPYPVVRAPDQP